LAEETAAERDRRFGALCTKLSDEQRAKVERMVHCRAEAGNDVRLTALLDGNVEPTPWVDRIIELAHAHAAEAGEKVGLIVIDHARLVMSGDPISSEHVTGMLRGLTHIAVSTGSAVLLLAHSPKSTIAKDGEADASEVFGSGAFVDHSRAAFVLHTMRPQDAKRYGFNDNERKIHLSLSVVKANYGNSNAQWWLRKEVHNEWQVVELKPAYPLPKGEAEMRTSLARKILELIKQNPGQLSSRALRDRYAGTGGHLAASERDVRATLSREISEGRIRARPPTEEERKRFRLSPNTREVLDLP
jgi:RecA-family ATPase